MAYGTITEISFWAGDKVTLKNPSKGMTKSDIFEVIKVNPKTLRVKHAVTGATFTGPHAIWEKASLTPEQTAALHKTALEKIEKESADFSQFVQGVVVELADYSKKPSKWLYPKGTKFVVIKHNFELVNIVKLGGDNGRYWRMNPNNLMIVTDF